MNNSDLIKRFYHSFDEDGRLKTPIGQLEFTRSCQIIERFVPPNAVVLDVGGATGPYSFWLAERNHTVHLIDLVPEHIETATHIQSQAEAKLASISVGDARDLPYEDESVDILLLFGPLYHLHEFDDRALALKEAYRVLKKDGKLLGAFIHRYASLFDGMISGWISDKNFIPILMADLVDGQHRNQTDNPFYFTSTKFHLPEEINEEVRGAGFQEPTIIPVEGPLWMAKDFSILWKNEKDLLLELSEQLEAEKRLWSSSPHLIIVGTKTG